jgi:PAS domain S-box-containing protein
MELNPAVAACVQAALSGSNIAVLQTVGAAYDCVLADIDCAGLPALLEGAAPVVVLCGGPTSTGVCADMVLAGAQDCLSTSQLSDGRLEHAIRSAIHRHAASDAGLQTELMMSEERYRGIVETAAEGIGTLDEAGVITFVNQRFADMLGYARSDLVGMSGFDLIHPDDVATTRERWRTPTDLLTAVEMRYCRSDGAVVWALVSRTRQSGSADPSWLVMASDITDRKLAEQDLAEREQRFHAIFDSAYDAILIADDDRRFVDVNPAACRMFARSREDLIGLRVDDVSGLDPGQPVDGTWTSFRESSAVTGVWSIVRPDGEIREIEYSATPNIAPGRHLSVARDITDRNAAAAEGRALQHRLNQAERLETVGQLAGGVAHDFNNILSIIVNYAELARTARDSGSVEEDLAEISAAAARGRALTRQLLIVSRRDVARPEVFDLAGLVGAVQSLLERVIGDRIRIETQLPEEPIAVSADRGRIDQLVMNLALNARDAMPAGGTLSMTVRRCTASGDGSIGDVELVVADNGVGMLDAVAARAFEPFYSTKGAGHGVGLGLAAAHGIVADAGGHISLESRLGEGTTVTVVFPRVPEDSLAPITKPTPKALEGDGRHVLIVEDDPKLLEATRRVLDRHGYVTSTASNAEDALVAIDGSTVETVLSDLVMPGVSGVGLAQQLRARRPDIHLVCMSGYSPSRGMLPDDVALLEKPFTPQELLAAVAKEDASG